MMTNALARVILIASARDGARVDSASTASRKSLHRRWARASRALTCGGKAPPSCPDLLPLGCQLPVRNRKVRLDRSVEDG